MTNKIDTRIQQKNILFIDSDKELIHDLQDYLEHHETEGKTGLNFVFVNTVKEALQKIAELKIDMIILEVVLPIVNGYYLLNALKKEANKIPVMIYTRLKGPQDLAKLASYEVDNIFLKQLMKMEDLVQMIMSQGEQKEDLDQVLLELKSQVKSLSDADSGANLKVIQCPRCNMILGKDSHFCNNCGQKIFRAAKKLTSKPAKKEDQQ